MFCCVLPAKEIHQVWEKIEKPKSYRADSVKVIGASNIFIDLSGLKILFKVIELFCQMSHTYVTNYF